MPDASFTDLGNATFALFLLGFAVEVQPEEQCGSVSMGNFARFFIERSTKFWTSVAGRLVSLILEPSARWRDGRSMTTKQPYDLLLNPQDDRPTYYERHRDQVRENQRLYRESNRDKIRAIHKAYYLKNRSKITAYKRERWHQKKTAAAAKGSASQDTPNEPKTHSAMSLTALLNPAE
ncbi:unnamed protein product [Aphanomyces euteiches]